MTENSLVVVAIFLFFMGLALGRTIWRIDPSERVTQIISCAGYEDDFLKAMGYQNRDSCTELNLALHRQYLDDCSKEIKMSNNESHDRELLDLCVYHLFEKDAISLSSEYANYKAEKIKK